jgi:predicted HicB family RNase H-like nuclease
MGRKGYEARVVLDEDTLLFHGEVLNTRDVITFQGSSVDELERAGQMCERGSEPCSCLLDATRF